MFINLRMDYKGHQELVHFYIMNLGDKDVFLGHLWLSKHNPEINWKKEEVHMSQCPKKECGYQSHRVVADNCSLTNV